MVKERQSEEQLLIYCSSDGSNEQPVSRLTASRGEKKCLEECGCGLLWKTTAVSFQFGRAENESGVIADSDKDMTDDESHQSRFSWLKLLIAVPGRIAMSCSDEQMGISNKGGEDWTALQIFFPMLCKLLLASKVNKLRSVSLPSFHPCLHFLSPPSAYPPRLKTQPPSVWFLGVMVGEVEGRESVEEGRGHTE